MTSSPSTPRDHNTRHTDEDRRAWYANVASAVAVLLDDETDWIAALATIACELHHAIPYFDWTGFYRVVVDQLVIGPYQGSHGCLRIAFSRGVCGAAARSKTTQLVDDVELRADHIACSSSSRSEIVVPVLSPSGELLAVLDVDSDRVAAFNAIDRDALESICRQLGARFPNGDPARR